MHYFSLGVCVLGWKCNYDCAFCTINKEFTVRNCGRVNWKILLVTLCARNAFKKGEFLFFLMLNCLLSDRLSWSGHMIFMAYPLYNTFAIRLLTAITFLVHIHLEHLGVRDVLVRGQEQHHIALLILNGHNIKQTPKWSTWQKDMKKRALHDGKRTDGKR